MRNTIAPTHIWKVTEPVASDRCREGTGVEHDDGADHAGDAETGAHREHRHPDRGEAEPEQHQRQPAPAAVARSIRYDPRPRHQQEQQHVVDRHHHADGRAMLAELVAHEDRDKRTQ
jgi:hypothetical protein